MTINHSILCLLTSTVGLGSPPYDALHFAKHLLEEGEYYRAVTEYKRALFFDSEHDAALRSEAVMGIGTALFLGEEHERAGEWLYQNFMALSTPESRTQGSLLLARSLLRARAAPRLLEITREDLLPREDAAFFEPLALARMGEWEGARSLFLGIDARSVHITAASNNAATATVAVQSSWKSPGLAAALGIVPGMGYIYSGHNQTGIASLLVNGIFFAATYQAFDSDQNVLGAFLALFSASWYTSNIYGSARAADRYNDNLQEELWSRIEY